MLSLFIFSLVLYCTSTTASPLLQLDQSPKPCGGRIVLIFETFTNLNNNQFENQMRFFGQRLFTPDYFNKYERLSVGAREFDEFYVTANFSSIHSLSGVKHAMEYIEHFGNEYEPASLEGALIDFAGHNFSSNPKDGKITAIFLVSGTAGMEIEFLSARVKDITNQGIRVVFIANGDQADVWVLGQIANDPKNVFKYDITKHQPDDYRNWFKKIIC